MTARGLALAVPCAALYALYTLAVKMQQVNRILGFFSLGDALLAWAPDLSFAIIAGTVSAVIFSRRRKLWRILWAFVYHPVMFFAVFDTLSSHTYFLSTGYNLAWSTVSFLMGALSDAGDIMAAESNVLKWFFIVSIPLSYLILAIAPRLPASGRRLQKVGIVGNRKALIGLGIALPLSVVFAVLPQAGGRALEVSRIIFADFVGDFIDDVILPEPKVEVLESERLDAPLKFAAETHGNNMNVVIILFESLRWVDTDVYVPGRGTTPFLKELAEKGAVVDFYFTPVPHSSKAMISLLCGIYPYGKTETLEATDGLLPDRCMGDILGRHGYRSAFFHSGVDFEQTGALMTDAGFDMYRAISDLPTEGFEKTNYLGYEEKVMVGPSMQWVDSLKGQPFLLTYFTVTTHHNYLAPQSFPRVDYGVKDPEHQNYLNSVRYTDSFIREVFEQLEERGLVENTLFIVVGDHGESFGEHFRRQHDLVPWDEALRIPALIHNPGLIPAGTRISGSRSHLDMMPTVLEALDIEPVEGSFIGSSLLHPAPQGRRLYFSCWNQRQCMALREGDIKVIYHWGRRLTEVFDTSKDPHEQNDLAHSGIYDDDFIDSRIDDMLRFRRAIDQQYESWRNNLWTQAVRNTAPDIATLVGARFGENIVLTGFDVVPANVPAGEDLHVRYVFNCVEAPDSDTRLVVHLDHEDGRVKADHVPAGGMCPVDDWEQGQFVVDEHDIHVPGRWASGKATLYVGFEDSSGNRLPVTETDYAVVDGRLALAVIDVAGWDEPAIASPQSLDEKIEGWVLHDQPDMQQTVDVVFGDKIRLAGFTEGLRRVPVDGTSTTSYVFQALEQVPPGWQVSVQFQRTGEKTGLKGDHVPIGGLYPPNLWKPGQYVIDQHRFNIYHFAKTGEYIIWLGFVDAGKPVPVRTSLPVDDRQRVRIGSIEVVTRVTDL